MHTDMHDIHYHNPHKFIIENNVVLLIWTMWETVTRLARDQNLRTSEPFFSQLNCIYAFGMPGGPWDISDLAA